MQLKNEFILAAKDYLYLIEKGYSQNATLKLVSDHYRLDKIERNAILRGVTTKNVINNRKSKIIKSKNIKKSIIHLDGYNFLFTISNYYSGNFCFIGMDGFIRDCANIGGRNKEKLFFDKAINILYDFYTELRPEKIFIYFDMPVSKSKEDARIFESKLFESKINFSIALVQNPDVVLSQIEKPFIVSTSDSVILDKTNAYIFDIFYWYVSKYKIQFFSLENFNKLKLNSK